MEVSFKERIAAALIAAVLAGGITMMRQPPIATAAQDAPSETLPT